MIQFIETNFKEIKYVQQIVAERYSEDPAIIIEPFGVEKDQ